MSREGIRRKVRDTLARYDTPLGILFLIALGGLWFFLAIRQEAAYPKLHAAGIGDWAVNCGGHGRTYRLQSKNVSGYRSSANVIQRSLSLRDATGEALYYTVRFDPDAYEDRAVWSFRAGRDSRLLPPRGGAAAVLYGDEERFEVQAGFEVLTVLTRTGRRLDLTCQPP